MSSAPPSPMPADAKGTTGAVTVGDAVLWDTSECIQQLDCEADGEILADVITAFVEDSRYRIEELYRAATKGQTTVLRKQVHSIKGASNQVAAKRMAVLCRQIEQDCGELVSAELLVMLDQLNAIFLSTSQVMLAHVKSASNS